MERMREQCKRALGDVKDFTRYLRDRAKDIERLNIRDSYMYYDLEGGILELMGVQLRLDTRE